MNQDILKGDWKQIKGRVQEKWGKLTNDDLEVIQGRRERLIGMLQERYGRSQDAIEREVDDFLDAPDR